MDYEALPLGDIREWIAIHNEVEAEIEERRKKR